MLQHGCQQQCRVNAPVLGCSLHRAAIAGILHAHQGHSEQAWVSVPSREEHGLVHEMLYVGHTLALGSPRRIRAALNSCRKLPDSSASSGHSEMTSQDLPQEYLRAEVWT